jgi:hypothetical protein
VKELAAALEAAGVKATQADVDELLKEVDTDKNSTIDMAEFVVFCNKAQEGTIKAKAGAALGLKAKFEQKAQDLLAVKPAPVGQKIVKKYEWDSANVTSAPSGKFKKGDRLHGVRTTMIGGLCAQERRVWQCVTITYRRRRA